MDKITTSKLDALVFEYNDIILKDNIALKKHNLDIPIHDNPKQKPLEIKTSLVPSLTLSNL
jgi:hypothetical protein